MKHLSSLYPPLKECLVNKSLKEFIEFNWNIYQLYVYILF